MTKQVLFPLIFALCLTACGDEKAQETQEATTAQDNPFINMANKIGDKGAKGVQKLADENAKQLKETE